MKNIFVESFFILLLLILVFRNCSADDEEESPDDDTEGGVKCYVCSAEDVECLSLSSYKARYKFLQTCKTGCAVLLGQTGEMGEYDTSIIFARGCDDLDKCDSNNVLCCKCDFDGCNINNYCNAGKSPNIKIFNISLMLCFVFLSHLK